MTRQRPNPVLSRPGRAFAFLAIAFLAACSSEEKQQAPRNPAPPTAQPTYAAQSGTSEGEAPPAIAQESRDRPQSIPPASIIPSPITARSANGTAASTTTIRLAANPSPGSGAAASPGAAGDHPTSPQSALPTNSFNPSRPDATRIPREILRASLNLPIRMTPVPTAQSRGIGAPVLRAPSSEAAPPAPSAPDSPVYEGTPPGPSPTPPPTPSLPPTRTPTPEPSPTPELGNGELYFHPESIRANPGESFTISLMASASGQALGSYITSILFDPTHVHLDLVSDGDDPLLGHPIIKYSETDQGSQLGVLYLSAVQAQNFNEPIGTRIMLARLRFTAREPSQTLIEIARSELVDPNGQHLVLRGEAKCPVIIPTPLPPPK